MTLTQSQTIRCCSRDALGALVRARRRRLGMSQDALARACGVTVAHMQRLELGVLRRLPPDPELHRIAAALDFDVRELLKAAGHGDHAAVVDRVCHYAELHGIEHHHVTLDELPTLGPVGGLVHVSTGARRRGKP